MLYAHSISVLKEAFQEDGPIIKAELLADLNAGIAVLQTAAQLAEHTFLERLKIEHHSRRHERDLLKVFLDNGVPQQLIAAGKMQEEMLELLQDQL